VVALFVHSISLADEVEKILFLVVEANDVIASNTLTGRFDRLDLAARERVLDYRTGNAVAVVVTNQRFAGYGALAGGWQTLRREAGEEHESVRAEDYSATVVTDDRLLNFNGRTGAWSQVRRSLRSR
jgi:RecB family exonuclease